MIGETFMGQLKPSILLKSCFNFPLFALMKRDYKSKNSASPSAIYCPINCFTGIRKKIAKNQGHNRKRKDAFYNSANTKYNPCE